MHLLYKVLVNIAEIDSTDIDVVRSYAEDVTRGQEGYLFDWRETDTAGRWINQYPNNVIFSVDDVSAFVYELNKTKEAVNAEITFLIKQLEEIGCGTSIDSLRKSESETARYYYNRVTKLICGDCLADSGFYDSYYQTSKLTDGLIEEIKDTPNDWALVFFDYHY